MQITQVLGYAIMLLASTSFAMPTEVSRNPANVLEKRTGHIDVTTWSGSACNGSNQGTTQAGTSGKCVNSSNAGSVQIGGASAKNPSGCSQIHAQYYLDTGCTGTAGISVTYDASTCHSLAPNQNSAFMKCVG